MAFWNREKKKVEPVDAGQVQKSKKALKRSPPVATFLREFWGDRIIG